MAAAKTVMLMSSDGENFDVDEAVAMESQTIKNMIKDACAEIVIPLPNVTGEILAKVIEYCKKHVELQKQAEDDKAADEEIKTWDADFVKVDQATLFHLFLAADYLNIESLLDLTSESVAVLIKGKTREEILYNFLKSLT